MRRAVGLVLLPVLLSAVVLRADPGPPPFPNYVLSNLEGSGTVELASFRGRPVLLTFWASWCGPCRVELPELQELYGELAGKGFVLLTVNVDSTTAAAQRFVQTTGISVPVYRMSPRDLVQLGVNSLPTNVLLDRGGRPVHISRGYSPMVPKEVRRLVEEMASADDAADGAEDPA